MPGTTNVSFALQTTKGLTTHIDPSLIRVAIQSLLNQLDRTAGYGMGLYLTDLVIEQVGGTIHPNNGQPEEPQPVEAVEEQVEMFYVANSPLVDNRNGTLLRAGAATPNVEAPAPQPAPEVETDDDRYYASAWPIQSFDMSEQETNEIPPDTFATPMAVPLDLIERLRWKDEGEVIVGFDTDLGIALTQTALTRVLRMAELDSALVTCYSLASTIDLGPNIEYMPVMFAALSPAVIKSKLDRLIRDPEKLQNLTIQTSTLGTKEVA